MATEQEKLAIREHLQPLDSPCIVELGAHCGEDEEWIRACCRTASHYVMVEPDPRNAQVILDKPTDANRRLILGAVADTNGMREFHFSENQRDRNHASGSLRAPSGHVSYLPWIYFPFSGMVPCYTLDTIFEREWLTRIDLLWVDIQGGEREMILGGRTALRHTRYAFLESEDVELYEGQALKPELIALLEGWTLIEDFGCNIFMRNDAFVERGPR